MSFIPYLRQAPTQTETSTKRPTEVPAESSESAPDSNKLTAVTSTSNDDPYGPRQWDSKLVKLSGKNRALNEFSVERKEEKTEQNLVMLHGYGAGLGFFFRNFEGLSRVPGWKVYALDLLGMGRSSRPPFRIHAKDRQASITEAEDWFIDILEEWRIERKIDRFTLLGHSLGGYLAVAYALKYPGHLNKLVLASPVGIPEDPYAMTAEMPDPKDASVANELTQDSAESMNGSDSNLSDASRKGDNNNFLNARDKNEKAAKNGEPRRKPYPKWLTYAWDANISPFSLVRWAGPLGPRFVSGWTSRRFSHLGPEEAQALHTYAYSLFKQRGSGEYALAYILAPGAFARSPLIRRIAGVGRQMIARDGSSTSSVEQREHGYPIVLMYGENDWMDIAGGYNAEQKIQDEKEKTMKTATAEDKAKDQGSAKVVMIGNAGHHLYLEGWEEFNEKMREEMNEVSRREKGRQSN